MGLVIDTSVWIAFERSGGAKWQEFEWAEEPVFLAAIGASELLHGVHRAASPWRRKRREKFVEKILASSTIIPFDLEVARTHAWLWADLSAQGQMIGAHDLLIAASALTWDLPLLTENERQFARVPDLKLVKWSPLG